MTDQSQANDGSTAGTEQTTTGDKLKQQFATLKSQATDKARDVAGQGKEKATGALDEAARFLEDTARTIEEKAGPQYGRYAQSAAESVSGFAATLRDKDIDDLVEDARDLVRKSPAVAIGAAVAVGFVLARLVKAGVGYEADATPSTPSTSSGGASGAGTSQGFAGTTETTPFTPASGTSTTSTPLADPTGGTSVTGSTEPTFPA